MLATTTSRLNYPGAGNVGPFPYTFKIWAASDLRVIKKVDATGLETTLNYPADFTVTGIGKAVGGNVTLTTALAAGNTLTIRRVRPLTQTTDLRNQSIYFREDTEDALDKLMMIDQQQQEDINRSFKVDEGLNQNLYDLIVPVGAAGQVIGWGPGGLTNITVGTAAGVALPAGGRTVATLSAFLANNAIYNPKDWDAVCNGVVDDTAFWLDMIGDIGDTTTMRYAKIFQPGLSVITNTLLFDRKSVEIFSTGARAGGWIWNGADNIPLFKFKRCWGVSMHHFRCANKHAVNKPSAYIELNMTAGDSPAPTRLSFHDFTFGGDGFDPTLQHSSYAGIVTSGNNIQVDQSEIYNFSISDCTLYGINFNASQNVFWNVHSGTLNCGLTASGLRTAAKHISVRNVFCQTNGIDYELIGDARIIGENLGSEISARFVVAATAGQFSCKGGYWQARSVNQAGDGQVIQMQGGVVLELENFEFTDNAAVGTLPKFWLRGSYVSLRLRECDKFPGTTWNTFLDLEPNAGGNYRIIDVSSPTGTFRNEYVFGEDRGDGITATLDPLRYDFAPNVRVRQDPWTAPALQNSWANQGSGVAVAGYYKDKDNVVHIRGGITGGATADGTLLFTLPVGYRPASQRFFRAHGTANAIRIFADGTVKLEGVSGATIYLDMIQFRAEA